MKKRFRIATVAGAVSLGLLTAGQANAAAPDCNTPKQITIKDAQAAQNINVDELLKKFNAQGQSAQANQNGQEYGTYMRTRLYIAGRCEMSESTLLFSRFS